MANYTAKRIDEMEAAYGGGFVKVRAELGVSSFGMQVIRLPGDFHDYPEHDHEQDGQEEVYFALSGSGWLDIDGERVELGPDTFVRVDAGAKRKVHSGADGLQLLAIGGNPGKVYEIPATSELTAA